jgi:putative endonuclease
VKGRRALGALGERKASRFLRRRGLRILQRNWRCKLGELDIIARDGTTLVFVEVRTSARRYAGGPAYTVGPHKRRKLRTLAQVWLGQSAGSPESVRFDVVAIIKRSWLRYEIDWIKNAFEA